MISLAKPLYDALLVALGSLGGGIAYVGHLAWSGTGQIAWRRLRFLGLVITVAACLQALARQAAPAWRPVVNAGVSLLDLTVIALAGAALVQLVPDYRRRFPAHLLLTLLGAAVFSGFLHGTPDRSLLAGNAVAAVCYLAGLALLGAMMLATYVGRLQREHRELREREVERTLERTRLTAVAAVAETQQNAADERLREEGLRADRILARNATLERMVVGAIQFGTLRISPELLQRIAQTVREVFGYPRVVLHLFSDTSQTFEARAFAGVDEAEQADLGNTQISVADYYALTSAGARVVVPLVTAAGDTRGFLDIATAGPAGPGEIETRHLEYLARLATTAIESAEAHDRLARNNAELAQASEKLKSLGEMKSNFLANVSHELRTPLTSMLAYTEMLRGKGDAISPPTRDKFLGVIFEEGEKLARIIDDLLQLDRMEDGQARLQRVCTDLVALARHLGESWRALARDKGIELTIAASEESVAVEVDAILCQQLLQHLVENALKFTPPGGQIRLNLTEQGTAVRIEVRDTGIGIPEDKLQQIFEQFYQVDDSATREHNGQGVGLAICHDIVSYHDGRIWAENVFPHGARFTVLLPRRAAVVIPAAPALPAADFGDPRSFLQRLLHWVGEGLGVRLVSLMTPDAGGDHLIIRAAVGLPESVVQSTRLRRGAGYAGRVWSSGHTLLLADGAGDRSHYTTESLLVVPLKLEEQVTGVIMVNNRLDGRPLDDDDRVLLEAMAPRLAQLLEHFDAHHETTREFAAIQATLRATTPVGRLHHTDVAAVCREIVLATARRLDLPDEELRHLAFALQYYDAGLGCVPPHLLDKEEPLSAPEKAQIERHVHASLETLAPLRTPPRVRQMILHHHERYDGSGYPSGLAGEAIPLGSRLIALADSLRALLQNRSYRRALPLADALAEIRGLAGSYYCPRATAAFLEEAAARRDQIEPLCEGADGGEDLKRPAPAHPATIRG